MKINDKTPTPTQNAKMTRSLPGKALTSDDVAGMSKAYVISCMTGEAQPPVVNARGRDVGDIIIEGEYEIKGN